MPAVFGRCKPVIYIDPLGGEDGPPYRAGLFVRAQIFDKLVSFR